MNASRSARYVTPATDTAVVVVPGLANGHINAYPWTTEQRVQLLDFALDQLPN